MTTKKKGLSDMIKDPKKLAWARTTVANARTQDPKGTKGRSDWGVYLDALRVAKPPKKGGEQRADRTDTKKFGMRKLTKVKAKGKKKSHTKVVKKKGSV